MTDISEAKASAEKLMMDRSKQVSLLLKLFERNGEQSAIQARKRADRGLSVTAKGLEFDTSVLKEALSTWDASRQGGPQTPEQPAANPKAAANPAAESPGKRRLKRKTSLGAKDSASPRPTKRLARKPPGTATPDENQSASAQNARPKAGQNAQGAEKKPSLGSPRKAAQLPRAANRASAKPTSGLSVKELKTMLASRGVDCAGCVEKADLEALWGRFEMWCQRPLSELQDCCEVGGGRRFATAEECARYLASQPSEGSAQRPRLAQRTPAEPSPVPTPSPVPEVGTRERDAQAEVDRILPLRKESYRSPSLWGFAVLEVASTTRDVSVVQRAYRSLMRKLHPDRTGQLPGAGKAVELVREAKEACERGLSRQEPPSAPRAVKSEALCMQTGRRRFKLCWTAPIERSTAPVRRYVVAAFDPAYGRALTITVLEPDYSEELRRFVSMEELTSYVLAEEDLQKMPKLWTQSAISVQVAAANEAGQSQWVTLQVPLNGAVQQTSASLPSPKPTSPRVTGIDGLDDRMFNNSVRALRGSKLREFLEPQKKGLLTNWLKSMNWSAQGSKQDLLERVIFIREAMPPA